jgi:hypothetical protein
LLTVGRQGCLGWRVTATSLRGAVPLFLAEVLAVTALLLLRAFRLHAAAFEPQDAPAQVRRTAPWILALTLMLVAILGGMLFLLGTEHVILSAFLVFFVVLYLVSSMDALRRLRLQLGCDRSLISD